MKQTYRMARLETLIEQLQKHNPHELWQYEGYRKLIKAIDDYTVGETGAWTRVLDAFAELMEEAIFREKED